MKKKVAQKVLGLSASVLLAGSFSLANAETIKIAIAGPQTGDVAQYGDMQVIGAEMAVEQINAAGGVNGDKIEAIRYDDACEPKQAVAVANKIVNDGIKFVVGHLCSGSTQPASDVYEDEGILAISPASTNPEITQRGYKMIFRTIGLDSHQGPTAGRYIADKIKPSKVAVIHDKQQYGEGIATAVKKTLEEKGVNVALFEGVNKGDKDFSPLIAKLQKEKVDFVYYGGYHPELGQMLRQAAEKGFKAKFMGPEGVGNKDISQIAGDASEGLLVTLPPAFDQRPENKDLVQAFKDKSEDPSGAFVMTSYAAVKVIADAVAATKSQDTDAIQEYLRSHTFKTPMGEISFDDKGDLKGFDFEVYTWHADGSKSSVN
ncbi:leucine ABC transporter subunit substrate-binding protein LivK [Hahella sp. CCB-MM4]|uniref:branched-chain amino acid ABC transporter substrate-binding protein n=1 Tax=Hahella sp. (strain CCB-MM4) TaxID=1926491 RepID=UPI000B9A27D5|nr:branched-chain amino acid ABC transporter substrate-binding protein [Hahella sp. CCB-MM4]OZG71715.1 leucine ABC transporter subunit substrate-binding protein LivK [Hahella sp. CCB-MM4]